MCVEQLQPVRAVDVNGFERQGNLNLKVSEMEGPLKYKVFKAAPSDNSQSLLNDTPSSTKAAIVYAWNDLRTRGIDYTIPDEVADLSITPTKYRQLKSLQAVMKSLPDDPDSAIFSHMLVSPNDLKIALGEDIVSELRDLQKDLTGQGQITNIAFDAFPSRQLSANRDGRKSFTTAGTVQTNPAILSPVAHSTRENTGDNGLRRLISHLNGRLVTIGEAIVEKLFPPATAKLQRMRQAVRNAPLYGDSRNYSFSTPQINMSPINGDLKTTLGPAGEVHIDGSDEPFGLSVLICMSNISENTHPGRFYHAETREWFDTYPFSIFIFRGTSPHGGTAPRTIPGKTSQSWERRINIILYPNSQFMNREKPVIYPRAATPGVGYSFFTDGEACFGGQSYHRSWCIKELVRRLVLDLKELGVDPSTVKIDKIHEAIPGILSSSDYFHPWSPEAESICTRVQEGNALLNSVRPAPKSPTRAEKSFQKQKASEEIGEKEKGSDEDESPSSSQGSVRVGDYEGTKGLQRPEERRSVNNNTNKKVKGKQNKRGQQDGKPREEDGGDELSSESDSPKREATDTELAALLRATNLFDVDALQYCLEEVKSYPPMLPSKFRHHAPAALHASRRQPAISSGGSPGPWFVEELFENAEHTCWAAEKRTHGKVYDLYLQSVQYRVIRDIHVLRDGEALKALFRPGSSLQGVGECTARLCHEIETICLLEAGKVKKGATYVISAWKILGTKAQPNSCCSVRVVLYPYRGSGVPVNHKAQHFREICARMMLWYPLSIVRRTEPAVPSEQAEEFQTEDGCRLVEYDRGVQRRTTKPLRLYFQKADILKTLAVAFDCPGFFCLPLLPQTVNKLQTLNVSIRSRLLKVIQNLREFPEIQDRIVRISEILTRLHVARAPNVQSGPNAGKTSSNDEQSQDQNLVKVNTLTTCKDGEQNQFDPSAVPAAIRDKSIAKRKLSAAPRSTKKRKTRAFVK